MYEVQHAVTCEAQLYVNLLGEGVNEAELRFNFQMFLKGWDFVSTTALQSSGVNLRVVVLHAICRDLIRRPK